jgi:hypothetical protein
METKYYYIHGLGSSKNSKKFLELKKQYNNIECLDWTIDDNITLKIDMWVNIIDNNGFENTCVIASSTGANFAVQLRTKLKVRFIHLVLINPLLIIDFLFDKSIIPKHLKPYLIRIFKLTESLILYATNDTVIDNTNMYNKNQSLLEKNHTITDNISGHNFETLSTYYEEIDKHVHNIYL